MESRLDVWFQMTVFPQHVGAGERRVAAEIDFDRWREPAEIVAVALLHQKCGLGETHLARDVQHPGRFRGFGENANARGIAGEGFVGERVDLGDAEAHAYKSIVAVSSAKLPSSARSRRPRSKGPQEPS